MKTCTICGEAKPLDQFHLQARGKFGRTGRCKSCWRDRGRQSRYGITPQQYDTMYDRVNGHCPLCGRWYAKLFIDHDHVTGEVRGLLCSGCNGGLGYLENAEWVEKARTYLEVQV